LLTIVANSDLHALSAENRARVMSLRRDFGVLMVAVIERGASSGAFDCAHPVAQLIRRSRTGRQDRIPHVRVVGAVTEQLQLEEQGFFGQVMRVERSRLDAYGGGQVANGHTVVTALGEGDDGRLEQPACLWSQAVHGGEERGSIEQSFVCHRTALVDHRGPY
jgi:hypothetical protein